MSKDTLEELFNSLNNAFDLEEPNLDHKQRFLVKLNAEDNKKLIPLHAYKKTGINWKPFLGVAASIVLLISVFIGFQNNTPAIGLAGVSPEMAMTQDFFTSTIAEELRMLHSQASPETKVLIDDAMLQLKTLESDYEILLSDLKKSGDDSRVIYAIISNFQLRIQVLENTLESIKNVKQLNKNTDENSTTI